MPKLAIVAALEREVHPLVRHWQHCEREHDGRKFRFFEKGDLVVVCGGIGAGAARRAAEAAISTYQPAVIYSAGFAGALDSHLKVGDVLEPQSVVNVGDGSRTSIEGGKGVLVSFGSVADPGQKAKLRESFGAQAVDMEAASVARVAEIHGATFRVIKAISDEFDFDFPSTERFIDLEGGFSEGRFALFAALRPWLWPKVIRLARNSSRAAGSLCEHLHDLAGSAQAGNIATIRNRGK